MRWKVFNSLILPLASLQSSPHEAAGGHSLKRNALLLALPHVSMASHFAMVLMKLATYGRNLWLDDSHLHGHSRVHALPCTSKGSCN